MITEEMILKEKDNDIQEILAGLLILHENLEYKNKLYENSLKEKDTLLEEIHHRVKNNLQVIKSLLALQSSYFKDEEIKTIFLTSQFRIDSIAMVHELLYQSKNLSEVDTNNYITNLSEKLISSIKGNNNNIQLLIDIPKIDLNLNTAVPLGLIINEIISNSLTHGIKNNDKGIININVEKRKSNKYTLKINDNGYNPSNLQNEQEFESLGLKLIFNLPKQLNGFAEFDKTTKGVGYIINFQETYS